MICFERRTEAGMDADAMLFNGHRVDVPYRVIAVKYYTELRQLLEEVGVHMSLVNYNLAISSAHADAAAHAATPYFRYRNALLSWLGGVSLPFLSFRTIFSLRTWRIVYELLCIVRHARQKPDDANDLTLDQ